MIRVQLKSTSQDHISQTHASFQLHDILQLLFYVYVETKRPGLELCLAMRGIRVSEKRLEHDVYIHRL